MDTDIEIALRLQANERGIYDENIINLLLNEYRRTNSYDIDQILESSFYMEEDKSPTIRYWFNSERYHNTINTLDRNVNDYEYELINNQLQNTLVQRYNLRNNINLNNNIEQNPFMNLLNMFTGGNVNFNQYQIPHANAQMNIQILTGNGTGNIINPPGNIFGNVGFNNAGVGTNIFQGFNDMLNNMLHFNDRVPVALTQDALDNIKDITYTEVLEQIPALEQEDTQCSICFSPLFENNEKYKYNILPCHHVFHSECIKPYLKDYDYLCPICKQDCGTHEPKLEN